MKGKSRKSEILQVIKILFELNKIRVTAAVAITTLTGYIAAKHLLDAAVIAPTVGLFLLACGSAVINHVQEKSTDLIMRRTKERPIPSGRITPLGAIVLAAIEIMAGSTILYLSSGAAALILGLIALVWYNVVYTPLKKFTPNAVIPGSFIGAIPPLVGWIAAGGSLQDPAAWILALFFFIWQIPHFYLLAMKYGKEYEKAGFPTLTSVYPSSVIKIMIYLWIFTTSVMGFLFIPFKLLRSTGTTVLLIVSLILLNLYFLQPFYRRAPGIYHPQRYFMFLNFFVLFVIMLLILENLIFV
jgi:protoheme IX farnesyltransferase